LRGLPNSGAVFVAKNADNKSVAKLHGGGGVDNDYPFKIPRIIYKRGGDRESIGIANTL